MYKFNSLGVLFSVPVLIFKRIEQSDFSTKANSGTGSHNLFDFKILN